MGIQRDHEANRAAEWSGYTDQIDRLFLGPADLPADMCCIRDFRTGGGSPADVVVLAPVVWAGWAHWMAPSDAELYRVDDARWLFPKSGQARMHYRAAHRAAASFGPPAVAVDYRGFESSAFGHRSMGFAHLLQMGNLVAQLRTFTGEEAELQPQAVLALATEVADRAMSRLRYATADWHLRT